MNTINPTNKGLVLIADEMHLSIIQMLENIGYIPEYKPSINRQEIIETLGNYEGLIIRSKTFVDEELLKNANQLKFIGRAGAGLDLIDNEVVRKKNIKLFAANEGNRVAVAEHLIGMLLCLMNKILIADSQVRKGIWLREANRGYELSGKTVGLVGYGNNGSETAKRLKAFDCKILAFDKFKSNFSDNFVTEASMETIFEEADILSFHIPLTDESSKMVNVDYLSKFQKPIYLLNASRGEIVVLKDVIAALENGKIIGACLDVLENEKLQKLSPEQQEIFEKIIHSDRVILTPHIAGWTHESYIKINEVLVEKIAQLVF